MSFETVFNSNANAYKFKHNDDEDLERFDFESQSNQSGSVSRCHRIGFFNGRSITLRWLKSQTLPGTMSILLLMKRML
jgi:hypothetical protein